MFLVGWVRDKGTNKSKWKMIFKLFLLRLTSKYTFLIKVLYLMLNTIKA